MKIAAIFMVVALVQYGSKKWAEAHKFVKKPSCSLVMYPRKFWYSEKNWSKAVTRLVEYGARVV